MPVIGGDTRIQPVYVGDVADAVDRGGGAADAAGRMYELGGPQVFTFRELLAWICRETQRHRPLVDRAARPGPAAGARSWRSFRQAAHPGPAAMLERDNVVAPGAAGLAELGIMPTPVELVVPEYLRRFRPGGGTRQPRSAA